MVIINKVENNSYYVHSAWPFSSNQICYKSCNTLKEHNSKEFLEIKSLVYIDYI